MSGGWIKLHRQILENGWLRNHVLWTFVTYCLLKASHKERKVLIGYQWVSILPGQFIFGRMQAAAELNMSERQIRTCLNRLKATNTLTIASTNKFSVVSVVNWVSYQSGSAENDQPSDHPSDIQATSQRPASDQPATTDKKEENEKKVKKAKPLPPEASRLSEKLATLVLENNASHSDLIGNKRAATIIRWAGDVEKLNRLDGQPWEHIGAVIEWCQADGFWSPNILSGKKLRDKFNQLAAKMSSKHSVGHGQQTPVRGMTREEEIAELRAKGVL